MNFYTNAAVLGDSIAFRGVLNGERVTSKVSFSPRFFSVTDKKTDVRTLDGKSLQEMVYANTKQAREALDQFKDVSGITVYGNENLISQFLYEKFPKDIDFDVDKIKTVFIDIEVDSKNGFPQAEKAESEVLSIALYNSLNKKYTVFGTKKFTEAHTFEYVECSSELDLFDKFKKWWSAEYPDIVTGWNVESFDLLYLINRYKNLHDRVPSWLSPFGTIRTRTFDGMRGEETSITIIGISILDYLELYKKFPPTPQESYKLDFIGKIELGIEKVDYSEYKNLVEFYEKDFNKFIRYNLRDVEIVVGLENKKKILHLVASMAYRSKLNFEDMFSPVKMWEAIINNQMLQEGIVPKAKISGFSKTKAIEGAYVKPPISGRHYDVVSFDATSLYPSIIMACNIGPETLRGVIPNVNPDTLLNDKENTLKALVGVQGKEFLILAANGAVFSNKTKSFFSKCIEKTFEDRKNAKIKMLELENKQDKTEEENRKISELSAFEQSLKIALNSLYGAFLNNYFKYFDARLGEAVTLTGQYIAHCAMRKANKQLNQRNNTKDVDYVISGDTDSLYIKIGSLVDSLKIDRKDVPNYIKKMNLICEKLISPELVEEVKLIEQDLNLQRGKIIFKREAIADVVFWSAKKRYILSVLDKEGVTYKQPKLVVKGFEAVKSSTPQVSRDIIKGGMKYVLYSTESETQNYIALKNKEFLELSPEQVAFPRSANNLEQYRRNPYKIPIQVRAALLYNDLIEKKGLQKKYQKIKEGEKIKFTYLVPNPVTSSNVIGFLDVLPVEFGLTEYVDKQTQFEKTVISELGSMMEDCDWSVKKKIKLSSMWST